MIIKALHDDSLSFLRRPSSILSSSKAKYSTIKLLLDKVEDIAVMIGCQKSSLNKIRLEPIKRTRLEATLWTFNLDVS